MNHEQMCPMRWHKSIIEWRECVPTLASEAKSVLVRAIERDCSTLFTTVSSAIVPHNEVHLPTPVDQFSGLLVEIERPCSKRKLESLL